LGPCKIGVEILEAELQLIVIEPLSASAKLAALQLLDDKMEPFDLSCASLRLVRSAASKRTIRCNVFTSPGRAARSMSMSEKSS
jgi:hypothetical protein